MPLETAAQYGAPTASASSALEARPGRAERQPARAQHLEHELLVALVDPGRRERRSAGWPCVTPRARAGTRSSQCAQRSPRPRTQSSVRLLDLARDRARIADQRGRRPTRSGAISAAVPGHEHLVGEVQLGADDLPLHDLVAEVGGDLHDRVAGDAGQDRRREVGRRDLAVLDDEDALAGAVRDHALVGQQDRLVVAGALRLGRREHRVEVDAGRLGDVRDRVRADALPGRDLGGDAVLRSCPRRGRRPTARSSPRRRSGCRAGRRRARRSRRSAIGRM